VAWCECPGDPGIPLSCFVIWSVLVTVFSILVKMTSSTKDDAWAAELVGLRAKLLPWFNMFAMNPKPTTGAQAIDRIAQVVRDELAAHG
jgi:hypothetical protein